MRAIARRLCRLENRTARSTAAQRIRIEYGYLKILPDDYTGPRHTVTVGRPQMHPKMKKGHGSKFGRKKEAAIAALMSGKSQAEAARAADVDPSTLKRWMRLPEFIQEYRRVRWEVAEQGYARAQQNTSVAVAVLLKLMVESATPASSRIRAALGVVDIARAGLDFDMETRVSALERAQEDKKEQR